MKKVIVFVSILVVLASLLPICVTAIGALGKEIDIDESCLSIADLLKTFSSKHVKRLKSAEDIYSVVFANADGTNTLYRFNEPIKYFDNYGNLKDKINGIVKKNHLFINTENDVGFTAFDDPEKGIEIAYKGIVLSIKAKGGATSKKSVVSNTKYSVTHNNYISDHTSITYSPTFSGVAIKLIIGENEINNEFAFDYGTFGCVMNISANNAISINDVNGEHVAAISVLHAVDSNGKGIIVNANYKENADCNVNSCVYTLSDKTYDEEEISYPVTVSATASFKTAQSDAVEYLAANQCYSFSNASGSVSDEYILLGFNREKGFCRSLYRFPYIYEHLLNTYMADRIVSVKLWQGVTLDSSFNMQVRPYTGEIWDDSTTYYDVDWNNTSDAFYAASIKNSSYYMNGNCVCSYIDITELVKIWRDTPTLLNPELGVTITNPNGEYVHSPSIISIYTTDTAAMPQTATFSPYLEITYDPVKIMLDPGHKTGQNQGAYDLYYEGTKMWELSTYLKEALEEYGFIVARTRDNSDEDLSVERRGKKAAGYDMFLSLHSDACGDETVNRVTVFYDINDANNASTFARVLSTTVKDSMNKVSNLKITDAKIKRKALDDNPNSNYYGVLRSAATTDCPLYYIIEHSFHTNYESSYCLYQSDKLRVIAQDEAAAINAFYSN